MHITPLSPTIIPASSTMSTEMGMNDNKDNKDIKEIKDPKSQDEIITLKTKFVDINDESVTIIYNRSGPIIKIYIVDTTKSVLSYHGSYDALMDHSLNILIKNIFSIKQLDSFFKQGITLSDVKELYIKHKLTFSNGYSNGYVHIPFDSSKDIDTMRLNLIYPGLSDNLRNEMRRIELNKKEAQELAKKKAFDNEQKERDKLRLYYYRMAFFGGAIVFLINVMILIQPPTMLSKLCDGLEQHKCDQVKLSMKTDYVVACIAIMPSTILAISPVIFMLVTWTGLLD